MNKKLLTLLAALFALSLLAAACGDDGDSEATDTTTAPAATEAPDEPDDEMMDHLGDGSLGGVTVDAGGAVQIRSLNAITGDVAFFGLPLERAVILAIEDYGQIHGFDVDLGTTLDDLCSNDGGQAAAQIVVADEDVLGVIGTSCSGAAVAAAPLITDAGMVMISGGNTSPALTSDLAGTPGENYNVGYYRTAHNDLFQGAAVAKFVFGELGFTTAAAIHDGDPYTQGLAQAFADAFEAEGGTITGFSAVNKEDTDMVPVLTEIAAGGPEALFFPIFQPAGDFVADQAPGVSGLENTVLLAADGLLNTNYLALPQTAGMYFSGPDSRFGENVNQSTGKTAQDFLAAYEERWGEAPAAPFWAHGYDATTMLLDAIAAASYVDADGNLHVDRQGIRDYLNSIEGFSGLIGTINCDDFGDCGAARITVVQNIGGEENAVASMDNVVFSFVP
ncbi:branched-chain amino acid ABC transporter substrate-binding protein [Candidatus Poriferisodalis sp.]|uniref:branched-chain amino acid ABC transporter substrate-binding protein n=1 Tax=Candidatus Poriferisodalis sp. TaxID=3101277 RepID=UPI003B0148A5